MFKRQHSLVQEYLEYGASLRKDVANHCTQDIIESSELISTSLRSGGKLLICGNGGSAADSQHLAAEFMNILSKDLSRSPLASIALTTDTSFITAYANDFSFEGVFARQVEALGKAGDVLLGISTSGQSPNVVRAVELAKSLHMITIGLTGQRENTLSMVTDVSIAVPSKDTQLIQECHLSIEHILCKLVETNIFNL